MQLYDENLFYTSNNAVKNDTFYNFTLFCIFLQKSVDVD